MSMKTIHGGAGGFCYRSCWVQDTDSFFTFLAFLVEVEDLARIETLNSVPMKIWSLCFKKLLRLFEVAFCVTGWEKAIVVFLLERECTCVYESLCVCVSMRVCVYVRMCVWTRESVCVSVRERECVCVSVRERVCVSVRESVCVSVRE